VFHVKHEGSAEPAPQVPLDRLGLLDTYLRLLQERAVPLGMIGPSDASRLRERHISDCLRAVSLFLESDATAVDLGSGAGLPGIPLAVALPAVVFTLVESRKRRAGFLELAIETLGLENATVFAGRVEDLTAEADVCVARAFAAPPHCWRLASRVLTARGRLIYWAGESFDLESLSRTMPPDVKVELAMAPKLERLRPLVMMCRQ
jgi:16S rRNA (guanine527-N7)-methyltransferase